jgi:hypothetical protein
MISSENGKISEYHTSSRRVIQLITEIDSEISSTNIIWWQFFLFLENEEVLNFQREQYLNILKENQTKNNYLKLLGMKMSIDKLFDKIMSLSEMKIELVHKLSHSSEIFIEGLDDFLEKNLENTESTASKEPEENEKKQEENKFENMESMQIIYSQVCGACKLLKNKLKMVKCSNEKVK